MLYPLKNKSLLNLSISSAGDFAAVRSFYHHGGIDLYCSIGQEVQAMEEGRIITIDHFTGLNAIPSSPWWNDTYSLLIEGKSGVIGYCEIIPNDHLYPGKLVQAGEALGQVIPVLKRDKGLGTSMLHLEYYTYDTTEHTTWYLNSEQPKQLLNPKLLLAQINRG